MAWWDLVIIIARALDWSSDRLGSLAVIRILRQSMQWKHIDDLLRLSIKLDFVRLLSYLLFRSPIP